MLKKVRNTIRIELKKLMVNMKYGKDIVFFSIGENCLPDNLLDRNNIKSFSSPYSSGRSNIEYNIFFEKENFKRFLDSKYLKYDYYEEKKVVRNVLKVKTENNYDSTVTNGFEFTHHDVIDNPIVRKKISRRCKKLVNLHNKKIYMLYHHRMCENTDEQMLIKDLKKLKKIYEKRNNDVEIYIFTQKIVKKYEERKIEKTKLYDGIYKYVLYTLNKWEGKDEKIFWAKCDDDLLNVMIKDIKNSAHGIINDRFKGFYLNI